MQTFVAHVNALLTATTRDNALTSPTVQMRDRAQRSEITGREQQSQADPRQESNSPACAMDFVFHESGSWTYTEKTRAQVHSSVLQRPDGLCHHAAFCLQCHIELLNCVFIHTNTDIFTFEGLTADSTLTSCRAVCPRDRLVHCHQQAASPRSRDVTPGAGQAHALGFLLCTPQAPG